MDTIRTLSIDAVQQANYGYQGTPIADGMPGARTFRRISSDSFHFAKLV